MTDLIASYWLPGVVVLAVAVVVLLWLLRPRRRIEIEAPTLDTLVATPTLSRAVAAPPIAAVAADTMPTAPPSGDADNLLRMKGVGPRLATRLGQLGVTRYDQIAGWSEADVDRIDAQLGNFAGRIARDRWIEQARLLATEDIAGFEAQFGRVDAPGPPA